MKDIQMRIILKQASVYVWNCTNQVAFNIPNFISFLDWNNKCGLSSFKIQVFFLCSNKSSRVLAPNRACGTKAQRVDSFGSHTNEREA